MSENIDTSQMTSEERMRYWQERWHDFFDEDETLNASGDNKRLMTLPDQIDMDDRLVFGLGTTTAKTREKCFGLFPNGAEMHRRVDEHLREQAKKMSPQQAETNLKEVFRDVKKLFPDLTATGDNPVFLTEQDETTRQKLKYADNLGFLLFEIQSSSDLTLFLREPLYAVGGNTYYLHEWVVAVNGEDKFTSVTKLLYDLWVGGWQVFVNEDEVLLVRRDN